MVLLKMKLVRLFSFFVAITLFILNFVRTQPNAPAPTSPSLPAFAYSGRYLCEICPLGLVCHDALPNPPVQGTCVDSCRSCLAKFCQLCSSPSNNYPPCNPAGTGSCKTERDCCGSYNGSAVCNMGLCGVPYGKFCWKDLDCVRGLICYKSSCRDTFGTPTLPLPTSTPQSDCTIKLEENTRLITYFLKENYNLIQLILAALRNVFPGAPQELTGLNDLNESASESGNMEISSTATKLNPKTDVDFLVPSSRATCPCKERCNEELQRGNVQVEAMRNERRLLLRVLQILVYGNQVNLGRLSNYGDTHPAIAEYVPDAIKPFTAPNVTTVYQGSNADDLMAFLSALQMQQNKISPFVKNNEDIFSNSVAGFPVTMRVLPNQPHSEHAEAPREERVPLLEALGQRRVPSAKHSQDDQIEKDSQNERLINENLESDRAANHDQNKQIEESTMNLQDLPAKDEPNN